jgi:hypothetical protein
MSAPKTKSFTDVLEPDGTQLRWVVARIPFDVAKAWPERVQVSNPVLLPLDCRRMISFVKGSFSASQSPILSSN